MIPRFCPHCSWPLRMTENLSKGGAIYAFGFVCGERGGCGKEYTYLPETVLEPPTLLEVSAKKSSHAEVTP